MSGDKDTSINEEQFYNVMKEVAKQLHMIVYDVFGVQPKSAKYSSQQLRKDSTKLLNILRSLGRVEPIKDTASPELKYQKIQQLDNTIRKLIRIPRGMDVLEYYTLFYRNAIKSWFKFGYLQRTNFRKCIEEMNDLTIPLVYVPTNNLADMFLKDSGSSVDAQIILQASVSRLRKYFKYLNDGKRVTKPQSIDKLIDVYIALVGMYEKLIRTTLGLLHILEKGEVKPYGSFVQPLANNVNHLRKKYPNLAGINVTVRNATAHHGYFVHHAKKTIDFTDRKNQTTLSFGEFLKETRELSARVMVLMMVKTFLEYHRWRLLNEEYRKFKKKEG